MYTSCGARVRSETTQIEDFDVIKHNESYVMRKARVTLAKFKVTNGVLTFSMSMLYT